MSTEYERMLEAQKKLADAQAYPLKLCRGETPQRVLWFKGAAWGPALEDGEKSRSIRAEDGTFGASEVLVNRLMHFAYLMGQKELDENSYRRGWKDAFDAMAEKLEDLKCP